MPQTKIDTRDALAVISIVLYHATGIDQKQLLSDPVRLDQELHKVKFDWEEAARKMSITRQQAYRWYHDTYQRHLFGSVS